MDHKTGIAGKIIILEAAHIMAPSAVPQRSHHVRALQPWRRCLAAAIMEPQTGLLDACKPVEVRVEQPAVTILNANRIMAISTVRPDGWPQTTIVGYANRGFELVFMIFRSGQKFANIEKDDRISIAVCPESKDIHELQAVYAAAHASQIADPAEREAAWRLLMERHSNLAGFKIPDQPEAVFMKARCIYVSVLDFSQGIGHREQLVVDEHGIAVEAETAKDEWAERASPAN